MQDDITSKINPSELRHFIRHVCLVSKNQAEKVKAREDLDEQIKKIKKLSINKKVEKSKIEKEIEQLNEKIDIVLQKESKLFRYVKVNQNTLSQSNKKIKALKDELSIAKLGKNKALIDNRAEIKLITDSISKIRIKMHDVIKARSLREDRIWALENKIQNSRIKHPSP